VVTVFIADDSMPYQAALTRVLTSVKGVQIVGQAITGRGALNSIRLLQPDVVILDLFMPEMNGIEVLRNMRCEAISSMVLVVTNHADAYSRDASKKAGADYFLDKSLESQRIAPILESLVKVFSEGDERTAN
jgi:DNA-binding NarL/FixJ family response regulator